MVPTNNRGMTYQNDEKHLANLTKSFWGWLIAGRTIF
jgi:hypothetical protein